MWRLRLPQYLKLYVVHRRGSDHAVERSKAMLIANLLAVQFKLGPSHLSIHIQSHHSLPTDRNSWIPILHVAVQQRWINSLPCTCQHTCSGRLDSWWSPCWEDELRRNSSLVVTKSITCSFTDMVSLGGGGVTFFLLLGLFATTSFQLFLQNPLLCYLRWVSSAQSGHQPSVQELWQIPTVESRQSHTKGSLKGNCGVVCALTSRCNNTHACCIAPVQSRWAGTGSWSWDYGTGSRCPGKLDAVVEAQASSVSCATLRPPFLPVERRNWG